MLADLLLTLLHLLIIGFNLMGWIWPATRRLHLVVAGITVGCWLILGLWFGIGYCPLTDWQWRIKTELGETQLPDSFIKYIVDRISVRDFPAKWIDWLTASGFLFAVVMSVYLNFFSKKASRQINNT